MYAYTRRGTGTWVRRKPRRRSACTAYAARRGRLVEGRVETPVYICIKMSPPIPASLLLHPNFFAASQLGISIIRSRDG